MDLFGCVERVLALSADTRACGYSFSLWSDIFCSRELKPLLRGWFPEGSAVMTALCLLKLRLWFPGLFPVTVSDYYNLWSSRGMGLIRYYGIADYHDNAKSLQISHAYDWAFMTRSPSYEDRVSVLTLRSQQLQFAVKDKERPWLRHLQIRTIPHPRKAIAMPN